MNDTDKKLKGKVKFWNEPKGWGITAFLPAEISALRVIAEGWPARLDRMDVGRCRAAEGPSVTHRRPLASGPPTWPEHANLKLDAFDRVVGL